MNSSSHVSAKNVWMIIAHDLVHMISHMRGVELPSFAAQILVKVLVQCTMESFDPAPHFGR